MDRAGILRHVAGLIPEGNGEDCILVGIDGPNASGKTSFADELAAHLCKESTRPVLRISIDDFHHPREIRYKRGRTSSEGYWLDNFDYGRFRADVVAPLSVGGSRSYRARSHDLSSDAVLNEEPFRTASPQSIVIIDGVFVH